MGSPYASESRASVLPNSSYGSPISLPVDAAEWDVPRAPIRFRPHRDLISRKEEERSSVAKRLASMPHRLEDRSTPNALGFFQADTSNWSPAKIAWVEAPRMPFSNRPTSLKPRHWRNILVAESAAATT